jgi:D-lactate dehydrogenase
MIKTLRSRAIGPRGQAVAGWLGRHFGALASGTRIGLGTADLAHGVLGSTVMTGIAGGARRLSGGHLPLWMPTMPRPARAPRQNDAGSDRPGVLYFPSCASRTMGPARGDGEQDALPAKVASLITKAGFRVVYPARMDSLCCGMPFESKGAFEAADAKTRELEARLSEALVGGVEYVVFDTSPCAFRTRQNLSPDFPIFELTEFIHDVLLDRLEITRLPDVVAVHPTCSNRKMGAVDKLKVIAEACVEQVILPEEVPCCGWAGDKGFTTPELNASAVQHLAAQLPEACRAGYSTSRTCEIGLSYHSGRPYRSIAYLVDRCSRPRGG